MGSLIISRSVIPSQTRKPCPVLLLDTSGSMSEGEPDRRIDLLWKAVVALHPQSTTWRTAVFNDEFRWTAVQKVPQPWGNTNLAHALQEVGKVGPTLVTVVTDGEPNDQEAACAAGVALKCPINIVFVGEPMNQTAIRFCQQVCERTKGTFATEVLTLQSVQALTTTMHKMLVSETTKPSAIAL